MDKVYVFSVLRVFSGNQNNNKPSTTDVDCHSFYGISVVPPKSYKTHQIYRFSAHVSINSELNPRKKNYIRKITVINIRGQILFPKIIAPKGSIESSDYFWRIRQEREQETSFSQFVALEMHIFVMLPDFQRNPPNQRYQGKRGPKFLDVSR